MKTRIKICCIASVDEAWMAIRCGASAVGLVSAMPSGPGVIPDALIAEIARAVPPAVGTFLLTSRQEAGAIIAQQRAAGVNTLQLCDRLTNGNYQDLRGELPGIALVQVIHVTGPESLDEARAAAERVDALLLDSGNPVAPVKELGGTGRVHDWQLSAAIREAVKVPVFLAGGLNASNVGEAIGLVRPFAVDVCSGVRTEGRLHRAKLGRFVEAVAQA